MGISNCRRKRKYTNWHNKRIGQNFTPHNDVIRAKSSALYDPLSKHSIPVDVVGFVVVVVVVVGLWV